MLAQLSKIAEYSARLRTLLAFPLPAFACGFRFLQQKFARAELVYF